MSQNENMHKVEVGEIRKVETNLIGKQEVFRMLALAESLSLPVLLLGPPGVAKTKTVTDYALAAHPGEDSHGKVFILETDEGSKPAEIKGFPDMQKLLVENKFQRYSAIAEAEFVVINEVDKANGGLRNAMLGVMNEKIVFNGKEQTPCKWKAFVATCNEIPKEEEGNPFWDRFILKMTVSRMTAGDMMKYYEKGDKEFCDQIQLKIPTMDEIRAVEVPGKKLQIFLNKVREKCTDRTLSFVPLLTKAVSLVYGYAVDKALVKVAEIVAGRQVAQELGKVLYTKEMKDVMDKIDLIPGITDPDQLRSTIDQLNTLIEKYYTAGKIKDEDIEDIKKVLLEKTKDHVVAKEVTFEEIESI